MNMLSEALKTHLSRINKINEYGYKFHQKQPVREVEDDENSPMDDNIDNVDGLDMPDSSSSEGLPPEEGGDDFNVGDTDEVQDGDVSDLEIEEPMDDTQEIDVTALVDASEGIQNRLGSMEQMQQSTNQVIQKINGTIDQLVSAYTNMSNTLQKIDDIQVSLKKMEPPTEDERRQALAQSSYPFKTPIPDYNESQKETQTDLEGQDGTTKVLTKQDLMHDYNEMDISKSFNK